jgi:modulator of FtsH protease
MQAPDFTSFFVASAGAGAALTGLLFVAVSVNPGRNAGPDAPPVRQAVAASAYTALINAFFISLAALIATGSLGGVAMAVSAVSIIATLRLIGDLFPPHLSRINQVRRAGFIAIGLLTFGLQFYFGLQYVRNPGVSDYAYSIAYLVLAVYAIGVSRAWQLLGAKRRGLFSWFSPLNELDEPRSPAPSRPESSRVVEREAAPAKPGEAPTA